MKRRISHIISLLVAALLLVVPREANAQQIAKELERLDQTLEMSHTYVDVHNRNIQELNDALNKPSISLERRYEILCSLYDAYRSFQFDRAIEILDERERVARQLGINSIIDDVDLDRAQLYSMAGMFLESRQVLDNNIDTARLNRRQLVRFCDVQQRFYTNFSDYTSDAHTRDESHDMRSYYRKRILELSVPSDEIYQQMLVVNHVENGEYEEAERLNLAILAKYQPQQHEYAMFAYDQARICELLGRRDDMKMWLARSAMADICSATKDHASLCSLAQVLIEENDIDRAFRYVTISLNDALYYNAKLRPWQISAIIPEIEGAYHEKQQQNLIKQAEQQRILEEKERYSRQQTLIISILAVLLLGICVVLVFMLMRSRKASRKIREMNERIAGTNAELHKLNERMGLVNSDLREANAVKEEYIALFLSMCSDYIEKLTTMQRNVRRKLSQGKTAELERELSSSSIMDEELNNFYDMFDNAFLNLYPNFVDEFNALLKPECHIELKRGEMLNTELRIFALIRLGISDSSRIAALLRYSVNTIYNYRARTKNNALGDRDSFEERIKTIGK